ncbi:MAG: glycerol-3-phosphate 1-O-acyltransferase PlsY [Oscillospiraceae bacterium]|nr:glycerol-3-phosphate 1-O-acyltransferase PlsY [Oscillospiraceae bacterium]
MILLCYLIMLAAPYLICGINSAIIVTRIKSGVDIRTLGSGGAGLTNVLRTQGKTAAVFVLFGDVLKGVASVIVVRLAFLYLADTNTADLSLGMNWIAYFAGIMACLGHVFPLYYGFKGGKGVLVTLAVLYAIDWVSASILLGIFITVVAATRYVSLGSVIAGACYPICVFTLSLMKNDVSAYPNLACSLVIAAILIFMHRGNIKRLINKTERKLGVSERFKKPDNEPDTE